MPENTDISSSSANTSDAPSAPDSGQDKASVNDKSETGAENPEDAFAGFNKEARNEAAPDAGKTEDQDQTGADAQKDEKEKKPDPLDQPITDWKAVKLEGDFDPDIIADFGRQAVELGLTPRQAQALATWEGAAAKKARERMIAAGTKTLSKEWGGDYERKSNEIVALVANIDRAIGNEDFSRAIGLSGAMCHPGFARGMARLAAVFAEDSIGARNGAAFADKEETAYEGLMDVFARTRGGRG